MEFEGEFETHLTVSTSDAAELAILREWAALNGWKFLHIVLARGETTSQPMLSNRCRGSLSSVLGASLKCADGLAREGFAVTRIKLEASPANRDLPQTDAEAERLHPNRYFEHHVKLALNNETEINTATRIAVRHAAHLSRNALTASSEGGQKRFVTQRCYRVGNSTAAERLQRLLEEIENQGLIVSAVEREFVVYDSNERIDDGWI